MLPFDASFDIARRYSDALFGYTLASINATYETTARTLAAWGELSDAVTAAARPEPATHEWSGAPRRPRTALRSEPGREANLFNPFEVFAKFWGLPSVAQGQSAWSLPQAPSPFAWWAWTPQSSVPATWPWAYGLISSGVPGSVAWPMAEANVALMDATRRTAETVPGVFPAYRLDNGFATAQVWSQPGLWPWVKSAA